MSVLLARRNKNYEKKQKLKEKDTQNGMMRKKFDDTYNGMLFLMDGGEHCFYSELTSIYTYNHTFININELMKLVVIIFIND